MSLVLPSRTTLYRLRQKSLPSVNPLNPAELEYQKLQKIYIQSRIAAAAVDLFSGKTTFFPGFC